MPPSISPTTQASHNPVEDNVYSLTELYHRAEALNNKGKLADLANLLLLGMERGVPFKLEIDGSMASEPAMAEVQRYYGNIIGVSQIICVTGVDLILETAYTTFEGLENEVHVSFTPPSHTAPIPLHTIPHMLFAKFQVSNNLILAFPSLVAENDESSQLRCDKIRTVWDTVIYPAMEEVAPGSSKGGVIGQDLVADFSVALTTAAWISAHEWMNDMVIIHFVEGRSTAIPLDCDHMDREMSTYLARNGISLRSIPESELVESQWTIDSMIKVSHPGRCVAWTHRYATDVCELLTGTSLHDVLHEYETCMVAHLTNVGGCRVTPIQSSLPHDATGRVLYTNVDLFVSEPQLSIVDQFGKCRSNITGRDIVAKAQHSASFLITLAKDYADCDADTTAQARVRVPLLSTFKLEKIDPQAMLDACVSFPTAHYWGLRSLQCVAYQYIVKHQRKNHEVMEKKHQTALPLTAAIVWLTQSMGKLGMDAVWGGIPFPVDLDRGLLFLRRVKIPPATRLPHFTEMSPSEFMLERDYCAIFGDSSREMLSLIASDPFPINTDCAFIPSPNGQPLIPFSTPALGGFGNRGPGIHVIRSHILSMADVDFSLDDELYHLVRKVIPLFVSDVLLTAPRDRKGMSVMRLNPRVHNVSDSRIFHQENLANVLRSCAWKHASFNEWERCFDALFPSRSMQELYQPAVVYWNLNYFKLWVKLSRELSPVSFKGLRCAVWSLFFQTLYWIPDCSVKEMWEIRSVGEFEDLFMEGTIDAPGPRVLINGKRPPTFNTSKIIW